VIILRRTTKPFKEQFNNHYFSVCKVTPKKKALKFNWKLQAHDHEGFSWGATAKKVHGKLLSDYNTGL